MSRTKKRPKQSPSERLRNVFYGLYIREKPMVDFETYYEEKMEKLIDHYGKMSHQMDGFSVKRGL